MKTMYWILIVAILAIGFGCIASQQAPNYVYVCQDGKQVANQSMCKTSDTMDARADGSQTRANSSQSANAQKPKKQNQANNQKNSTIKPQANQTAQKQNASRQGANQTKPKAGTGAGDDGPPSTGNEITMPTGELNSRLAGSLLLGRPTNESISLSILATAGMEAYAEYGTSSGAYTAKTSVMQSVDVKPIVLEIAGLMPDTLYYYRAQIRKSAESGFSPSAEHTFRTQRMAGESFSFAIQADPHRDGHTDENVYRATLQNELAAKPDFLIDLGDTFMTEKFATNQDQVNNRYIQDREFFGIIGNSVPVFLVNGNHDGEQGWVLDGTANNDAIWATEARKTYYLPEYSSKFYYSSITEEPIVGVRASYYAWQWGDALFVVVDPYWNTKNNPKSEGDLWQYTLGDGQYQWLKKTLEASNAKYKFVFSHHLLGDVRGSTYWAPYFEWGGKNRDGSDGFSTYRPGWEMPIHQLMLKNNVTIFFQGHDHLYCREDLDGLVYQEVPQPGSPNGEAAPGAEYNYHGNVLPSSGFLLVNVTQSGAVVQYMKTELGKAPQIADKYTVVE